MAVSKNPVSFNLYKENPYPSALLFRGIVLALSLANCYFMHIYEDQWEMFCTNWGQVLVTVYYLFAFLQALLKPADDSFLTKAVDIIFHLTLALQFLIFVFYWPLLSYDDIFNRIMKFSDPWRRQYEFGAQAIWRHLVNPLLVWIPVLVSHTRLGFNNFGFFVLLMVGYLYVNYSKTQYMGKGVYPMMDWKSMESHIHVGLGIGLALAGFWISSGVSKAIRSKLNLEAKPNKSKNN